MNSECDSLRHPRLSLQLSLSHFRPPSQSHLHCQQWLMRSRFSCWRPTQLQTESFLVGQNVPTQKVCPAVQRAHLKCCLPELGADWNVKYYGMRASDFTSPSTGERYFPTVLCGCLLLAPRRPASLLRRHLCPKVTPPLSSSPLRFLLLCLAEARSSTALERTTLTPVGEAQQRWEEGSSELLDLRQHWQMPSRVGTRSDHRSCPVAFVIPAKNSWWPKPQEWVVCRKKEFQK